MFPAQSVLSLIVSISAKGERYICYCLIGRRVFDKVYGIWQRPYNYYFRCPDGADEVSLYSGVYFHLVNISLEDLLKLTLVQGGSAGIMYVLMILVSNSSLEMNPIYLLFLSGKPRNYVDELRN